MSDDTKALIEDVSRGLDRRMITLAEVIEYLQITKSCFYSWKRGRWNPSPESQERLRSLVKFLRNAGL